MNSPEFRFNFHTMRSAALSQKSYARKNHLPHFQSPPLQESRDRRRRKPLLYSESRRRMFGFGQHGPVMRTFHFAPLTCSAPNNICSVPFQRHPDLPGATNENLRKFRFKSERKFELRLSKGCSHHIEEWQVCKLL